MAKNEMTREEASKKLSELKESIEDYAGLNEEGQEMFRMAIEALKAEPCEDAVSRQAAIELVGEVEDQRLRGQIDLTYAPIVHGLMKLPPVNYGSTICEDAVSRQAAAELVMKYCPDDDGAVQCDGDIRELLDELENLPFAQPEPKEGHWIYHIGMNEECSVCRCFFPLSYFENRPFEINYCPNCGAKMTISK